MKYIKNLKYIKTADPHNFNSTIFWYGKQRDQNWGNFSIHNFTTTYYTVWYWPKLLRTDEEASVIIGNQMNRCKTAMNFHKYVINFLERNIKLFPNFVKISFGCHIKFVLLRQWTINKTAIRISFYLIGVYADIYNLNFRPPSDGGLMIPPWTFCGGLVKRLVSFFYFYFF